MRFLRSIASSNRGKYIMLSNGNLDAIEQPRLHLETVGCVYVAQVHIGYLCKLISMVTRSLDSLPQ